MLILRVLRPSHLLEFGALQPYLCYEPVGVQCKVTVVLTPNVHTLRSGMHTRPRYSEDTDSYTAQLDFNIFVHLIRTASSLLEHVPQCAPAWLHKW